MESPDSLRVGNLETPHVRPMKDRLLEMLVNLMCLITLRIIILLFDVKH